MTVRERKRKNKLRGQRTHGKGDTKNKRGAGSRGGRGKAGSHKHKFTKYYAEFGKDRKVREKSTVVALNLDEIEQLLPKWILQGKIEKGSNTVIDGNKLGFSKVLARGKLKSKIVFENVKASKKAVEKIKESGSTIKEEKIEKEVEENGSS